MIRTIWTEARIGLIGLIFAVSGTLTGIFTMYPFCDFCMAKWIAASGFVALPLLTVVHVGGDDYLKMMQFHHFLLHLLGCLIIPRILRE